MNIKTKLFITGVIILLEIFASINIASAQVTYTTCNSAVINDYVTPNGISTNAWFEWGSTQYFGNSTPRQIFYSNSNFSQLISGLTENTTYYYRIMSSNNYGITTGYTKSFSTYACSVSNPTAITSIATNIGQSSARLNGVGLVNNGAYTTGYFEYGTTQTFGNTTSIKSISNAQLNPFYESLFNLASGTTYYYQAVVTNQYGTSRGNIVSFRTSIPTVYVDTNIKTITANRNTTTITNIKNTVKDEGTTQIQQGALAFLFGGNDFFPNTLLGWLLLILVIILLILAVKKAYYESRTVVASEKTEKKHS